MFLSACGPFPNLPRSLSPNSLPVIAILSYQNEGKNAKNKYLKNNNNIEFDYFACVFDYSLFIQNYVPKVPSFAPRPIVAQAICPPPFQDPDQQRRNCMGPVQ